MIDHTDNSEMDTKGTTLKDTMRYVPMSTTRKKNILKWSKGKGGMEGRHNIESSIFIFRKTLKRLLRKRRKLQKYSMMSRGNSYRRKSWRFHWISSPLMWNCVTNYPRRVDVIKVWYMAKIWIFIALEREHWQSVHLSFGMHSVNLNLRRWSNCESSCDIFSLCPRYQLSLVTLKVSMLRWQ